jgi:hypothetical protein
MPCHRGGMIVNGNNGDDHDDNDCSVATSSNDSFYNCDGDSVNNNNGGWYENSNIGRILTIIYSIMDFESEIFKYKILQNLNYYYLIR